MRLAARIYLNDLNAGKAETVRRFLHLCHDMLAYYVEMFWRAKDFSANLADLASVHRACERFGITTLGRELKKIDFSTMKVLVIEDLKWVRHRTRGKFPQVLNRRLSYWLYATIIELLARRCEELGIRLVRKSPADTSITCSVCDRCDRRSRVGDGFQCRHGGFSSHADLNAALNLKRLGEAGVYGLRSLPSWSFG